MKLSKFRLTWSLQFMGLNSLWPLVLPPFILYWHFYYTVINGIYYVKSSLPYIIHTCLSLIVTFITFQDINILIKFSQTLISIVFNNNRFLNYIAKIRNVFFFFFFIPKEPNLDWNRENVCSIVINISLVLNDLYLSRKYYGSSDFSLNSFHS